MENKAGKKHFEFDAKSWDVVLTDMDREARRLEQFTDGCPRGRARDIREKIDELKRLMDWNPPNYNDKGLDYGKRMAPGFHREDFEDADDWREMSNSRG